MQFPACQYRAWIRRKIPSNPSPPFQIKDITRNIRKAVVATTLSELRVKVSVKFERAQPAIHLDCDGTEVDDEEYFSTLEPNAELIAALRIKPNKRALFMSRQACNLTTPAVLRNKQANKYV